MMEDWMLSQPSSTQTVWEWAGFGSTVRPWVRIYMVGQNAVLCLAAVLNQWTYLVAYHMIYNDYGKRSMDTLKKSHRYPQKRSQQILQGILCSKGKYDIIIITILSSRAVYSFWQKLVWKNYWSLESWFCENWSFKNWFCGSWFHENWSHGTES